MQDTLERRLGWPRRQSIALKTRWLLSFSFPCANGRVASWTDLKRPRFGNCNSNHWRGKARGLDGTAVRIGTQTLEGPSHGTPKGECEGCARMMGLCGRKLAY